MENIIRKLSEKYNIPEYHIRVMVEAPFRLFSEEMEKRSMKGLRLKWLGKFCIHEKKKKWIKENILEKALQRDKDNREKWEKIKVEKDEQAKADSSGVQ